MSADDPGVRCPNLFDDKFGTGWQRMKEDETREQLEKRMDELACRYTETHDPKIKAEIEELSLHLAKWNSTLN